MSQALIFMALVPLAIAAALGLALIGGRLAPACRRVAQHALGVCFYAAGAGFMAWRAATLFAEADRLGAAVMVLVAVVFTISAASEIRHLAKTRSAGAS